MVSEIGGVQDSLTQSLIEYRDKRNPYKFKTDQWYGWFNAFSRVINYVEGRTPLNPNC